MVFVIGFDPMITLRQIWAIWKKEVVITFSTPMAFVLVAGTLVVAGNFFFIFLQRFNSLLKQSAYLPSLVPSLNLWVLAPYYQSLQVILIFLIPIITMRIMAEERRSGTFELLATSPLSVSSIVWGKFLAIASTLGLTVLSCMVFPILLLVLSDPEPGPLWSGALGVFLFALSYGALGLAVSSGCKNPTAAGIIGLVLMLTLYVIDDPASKLPPSIGAVLSYIAPPNHTELMHNGVISSRDVVYFLSLIAIGIFASNRVLDGERWRS